MPPVCLGAPRFAPRCGSQWSRSVRPSAIEPRPRHGARTDRGAWHCRPLSRTSDGHRPGRCGAAIRSSSEPAAPVRGPLAKWSVSRVHRLRRDNVGLTRPHVLVQGRACAAETSLAMKYQGVPGSSPRVGSHRKPYSSGLIRWKGDVVACERQLTTSALTASNMRRTAAVLIVPCVKRVAPTLVAVRNLAPREPHRAASSARACRRTRARVDQRSRGDRVSARPRVRVRAGRR
jgi:hypothetical protein